MKILQNQKPSKQENKGTIGSRIKDLRTKAGYKTQKEFADALGVSKAVFSRWENDKHQPDLNALGDIATLVGSNCDYIIRGVSTEHLDAHKHYGLSNDALNVLAELNTEEEALPDASVGKLPQIRPIEFINRLLTATDDSRTEDSRLVITLAKLAERYVALLKPVLSLEEVQRTYTIGLHNVVGDSELERTIVETREKVDELKDELTQYGVFSILSGSEYLSWQRTYLREMWIKLFDNVFKDTISQEEV